MKRREGNEVNYFPELLEAREEIGSKSLTNTLVYVCTFKYILQESKEQVLGCVWRGRSSLSWRLH